MKLTLNPEFYSKKRILQCPKCKKEVEFTFAQLNSTVTCPNYKATITLVYLNFQVHFFKLFDRFFQFGELFFYRLHLFLDLINVCD